jgi:hypothetical protein
MSAGKVARSGVMLALIVVVSACSRGEPNMMQIGRGQTSPDEFVILPSKPIELPENMTALPPPIFLGGGNRADATPVEDAVVALGGNPARTRQDGRISNDGALIRQTTRYGVDPQIRPELALADLEFRRRNRGRLLERWAGVPTYYKAYKKVELNQHAATAAARQRGLPTPAVPPDPTIEY